MKTFLVGGAVRDQLLGFPFTERDWVVVGATPEEMLKQGFRPVGKDFPVFLHPQTGEEYALARTERKTAPGYKGFVFHTDTDVGLEDDLERRDLTINAMAQDENGELIDPYGGQDDLDDKKLRHVSLAFIEDPVRILRVARFSARYHHLGFHIVPETLDLMHAMVTRGETRHLVAERVWQECHKAINEASPTQFFHTLQLCDALKDIFPELTQETYPLCMESLLRVSQSETHNQSQLHQSQLRFAALCQPLALESIEALCQRLGVPNRYRDLTLLCKKLYNKIIQCDSISAQDAFDVIQKSDGNRKTERFLQLIELCQLLAGVDADTKTKTLVYFWQHALDAFQSVDHQALIKAGYQKAELGDAINQARLDALRDLISNDVK